MTAPLKARTNDHGRYIAEPLSKPSDRIDLTGIYGSCSGLKPLSREDREFEDCELDWEAKLLKRG
jgi:antitoxin VapB